MGSQESKLTTSDAVLIERARSGDRDAFGELWRRHYLPAARVARRFTSSIDADDLVSEAYARIYKSVLAGGGPSGAFRPYLYTTIRNLASTWGAARRDVNVDVIEEYEDERIPEDPAAWALDRTLTARAFRSLPERWQTVLWYTEVEGMDPHEVAPILGITANSVAALSYRAREGLRKAWLQAHVNDATASGECRWTMTRLGEHTRDGLGARDRTRIAAHLADCASCTIVSEEVEEVGSRLALVMLPLILGGVAGGSLLAAASDSGPAMALTDIPDLPASVEAIASTGAAVSAPVAGGLALGALSGTGALVGSAAIVAVVGGSVLLGVAPTLPADDEGTTTVVADAGPVGGGEETDRGTGDGEGGGEPTATEDDPDGVQQIVDDGVGGVVGGVVGDVDSLVDGGVGTISGSETPPPGHTAGGGVVNTDVQLSLSGTGTPGAHVSLQAAGQVYATTTVGANGTYTLVTVVPGGVSSLQLVQTVDKLYLADLLGIDGLLAKTLGTLDGLVQALIKPLTLGSSTNGLTIQLLS